MKRLLTILAVLASAAMLMTACQQSGTAAPSTPHLTVYMQMGGTAGDPSTLARTNGAKAAAAALGITLVEQYSGWDSTTMIQQFDQAVAAHPDGIVIMGHPGVGAFQAKVDAAEQAGIVITSGNNPLPSLAEQYRNNGFGYAGAQLYAGGYLTGQAMVAAGLHSGDHALIYDIWHNESRALSDNGMKAALEAAGVIVDTLDVTNDVDTNPTLAGPILTAYLASHPDLKAIGTQHGNITSQLPQVLQAAGKAPGQIIVGGIDLSSATINGIQSGYISVSFDQVLYLQGYFPILQIWLTKNYKIPGLTIDTGVGTVTPQNIADLKPLIDQGIR